MRLRARTAPITEAQRAAVLSTVSVLLGYPDADVQAAATRVAALAPHLPEEAAAPLRRFAGHLAATPLAVAQQQYVDTFDLRRRCCLYLTWFSHGDTRKRGMALLRFTHAYKSAGVELVSDELPDHLGVVCEFAATEPVQGLRLLTESHPALVLLATALQDLGSPYGDLVAAVRAVLDEPTPRDLEKAWELARTGPPEEEVGLEPYGPPELLGGRR